MDHLTFRRSIAISLIQSNREDRGVGLFRKIGRASLLENVESRYDIMDHLIKEQDKQTRCRVCHKKVSTKCRKYKVALHPGPSQIPTFGSGIPQFNSRSRPLLHHVQTISPLTDPEISLSDIGRRVRVTDQVGTLRFVGNVHFATGLWCGIELDAPTGKHDGLVKGVRYFCCSPGCGKMASASKVVFIETESKEPGTDLEYGASGPYSMLFLDNVKNGNQAEPENCTYNLNNKEQESTFRLEKHQDCTYDIKNNVDSTVTLNKSSEDTFTFQVQNNSTFNLNTPQDKTFDFNEPESNSTFITDKVENNCTTIDKQQKNCTFDISKKEECNNLNKADEYKSKLNNSEVSNHKINSKDCGTNSDFASPQYNDFENRNWRQIYNFNKILHNKQLVLLDSSSPIANSSSFTFLPVGSTVINSTITIEEEGSKRDSLDLEESLGILTPEQMVTADSIIINDQLDLRSKVVPADIESPINATEFSLGIIDEHLLSNITLKTDTTMNMELPLDTLGNFKDFTLTRLEQTPSPEELPLDPTPIVEIDPKTEPSKSKTSSSFITSITSITSLDTGYQGDGEMSRPASRGADNSPLTRRPLPRPQPRRPDPMTDSDFYTESDADNHEDNPLRGDRKAQVIDGTLYGVDPQAAADIYVNNRENMDSSGIFTDLETNNTPVEESDVPNLSVDVSPSDSSKTISDNSQDNIKDVLNITVIKANTPEPKKENSKKRSAPSPSTVGSSPSSMRSPRHNSKEESRVKKFKMPKKDTTSTPKTQKDVQESEKKTVKKPLGKWDVVMSKISKTDYSKTNYKDVKSKVFNINSTKCVSARTQENEKTSTTKPRRFRSRINLSSQSPKTGSNVGSSIHSSLSDLSGTGHSPKKIIGSAKKREVVQVTQVLTASKLSPKVIDQNIQNAANNKKSPPTSGENKFSGKRIIFSSKDKKQTTVKESARGTVKGGRTTPAVRPPPATRVPVKNVPKVAEALAVLVQHLVFNVEAYQVPKLKKDVEKFKLEAEEVRLACQHLEETLSEERAKQAKAIDEERMCCKKDLSELIEMHKKQIAQVHAENQHLEQRLLCENETVKQQINKQHEDQLLKLRSEFQKLQKTHEESLVILREENDAIREQIDEKNLEIDQIKHESRKLKEDYEDKEIYYKEQINNYNKENQKLKDDNERLQQENNRFLSSGDEKGISLQEVQSLRVVLELKQNEVSDLRKALGKATQKAESLQGVVEKAAALQARCEDLEHQLQRKNEHEQSIIIENKKLHDSIKEENNQNRRLSQHVEELQWKIKQNKEVMSKVIEQTEDSIFKRSLMSVSFNERHASTPKPNLERTLSFREQSYKSNTTNSTSKKSKTSMEFDVDDLSPPTSPKVKGVVEKSDSVSYVLDLDEDPDIIASRIVRRSFRNSTPPKNTPTKSPCNKRPRMKNMLSLSASTGAILSNNKSEYSRHRSNSARNEEMENNDLYMWSTDNMDEDKFDESCESSCSPTKLEDNIDLYDDHDVDLKLPALPSELNGKNRARALPSPKHLAGEAMISESNSEDESTSSSSVQL